MRIGIIGGGASGVAVLRELSDAVASPGGLAIVEIVLLDGSGFDGGVAYRTRNPHHLLNMKSGTMSAVAGDDGHFLRWLRGQGHDAGAGEHLPRATYGAYLADLLEDAAAHCAALGVTVHRLEGQAEGLARIGPDRFRVQVAGGAALDFDAVILCTGHNAPADHYELGAYRNFSADPYALVEVADEPGTRIGIIGTGLTAVDNALALGHTLRHVHITCLSRSGRFPKVQPQAPVPVDQRFRASIAAHVAGQEVVRAGALARQLETALHETAGITLDFRSPGAAPGDAPDGATQFEGDVAEAECGRANTYSYLATVTDLVCGAWRRMEDGERSYFMRHVYSGWMRNRHAMPLVNARKLRTLIRSGRLGLAGGVTGIARVDDCFEARFADGGAARFDALISAAGPSYCVEDSPLYIDAARNGVLQMDPFGGVRCAHPDGRVLDGAGRPHRTLFAVGSPTRGSFFYAAAMDIIVARTRTMVASLLRDIAARPLARTASLAPLIAEG